MYSTGSQESGMLVVFMGLFSILSFCICICIFIFVLGTALCLARRWWHLKEGCELADSVHATSSRHHHPHQRHHCHHHCQYYNYNTHRYHHRPHRLHLSNLAQSPKRRCKNFKHVQCNLCTAQIGSIHPESQTGPQVPRSLIWEQGCHKRCKRAKHGQGAGPCLVKRLWSPHFLTCILFWY